MNKRQGFFSTHLVRVFIFISFLALTGCASTRQGADPQDPYESINRATFKFNRKFDTYVLKPLSQGYKAITPSPVRTGVTDFFANMGEIPTMANDLLQGHFVYALSDGWRFMINTTIGIGGLFDVASHMKLEKRYNDLGITLAVWGYKKSAYFVIPFMGPSTIRDGIAIPINYELFTLWPYINPVRLRNSLFVLDVVNLRAAFLNSEDIMKQAALDPYIFIRNAYLQKRNSLIEADDGNFIESREGLNSDPLDYDDLDYALGKADNKNSKNTAPSHAQPSS